MTALRIPSRARRRRWAGGGEAETAEPWGGAVGGGVVDEGI